MVGSLLWVAACGGARHDSASSDRGATIAGTDGKTGNGGNSSGNGDGGKVDTAGTGDTGGTSDTGGTGGSGGNDGTDDTGGTGGDAKDAGGTGGAPAVDPDRNKVTPGKICSRHAEILCAAEAQCCTDPGRTVADCEAAQQKTCGTDVMADAIAAQPEVKFNAARAEEVFTEIERLAMDCDPSIAAFSASDDGLRSMFDGTADPNADCTPADALDQPMFGAALASCKQRETYGCLPNPFGWTCAKRGDSGSGCYSDLNCISSLYCDNNPAQPKITGGKCGARKDVGASCEVFYECESLYCQGGKCIAPDEHASFCLPK